MSSITINLNTSASQFEVNHKRQAMQTIADKADMITLKKIAELISKPGACEKFLKALDNPLVKAMF